MTRSFRNKLKQTFFFNFAFLVILTLLIAPSTAKSVNNLTQYSFDSNNLFWNYDFRSYSSADNADSTNVDWPVTLIFYSGSSGYGLSPLTIYGLLDNNFACAQGSPSKTTRSASDKYMEVTRSGNQVVEATSGNKFVDAIPNDNWNDDWEVHIRAYGGGYAPGWGWWVVATTHVEQGSTLDTNAQNPELGEEYIASIFRCAGYSVYEDYGWLNNYIPGTYTPLSQAMNNYEGNSDYNNGYATYIYIDRWR